MQNVKIPPFLFAAGDGAADVGAADGAGEAAGADAVVADEAVDIVGLAVVVVAWAQPARTRLKMSANAMTASITLLMLFSFF